MSGVVSEAAHRVAAVCAVLSAVACPAFALAGLGRRRAVRRRGAALLAMDGPEQPAWAQGRARTYGVRCPAEGVDRAARRRGGGLGPGRRPAGVRGGAGGSVRRLAMAAGPTQTRTRGRARGDGGGRTPAPVGGRSVGGLYLSRSRAPGGGRGGGGVARRAGRHVSGTDGRGDPSRWRTCGCLGAVRGDTGCERAGPVPGTGGVDRGSGGGAGRTAGRGDAGRTCECGRGPRPTGRRADHRSGRALLSARLPGGRSGTRGDRSGDRTASDRMTETSK